MIFVHGVGVGGESVGVWFVFFYAPSFFVPDIFSTPTHNDGDVSFETERHVL